MTASLTFDEHVSTVEVSGLRLAELAERAGLAPAVPTCPTWTIAHLVAHQAMVHRWADSHVRGEGGDALSQTAIREEQADLVGYYREGHAQLLGSLRTAPADLEAMTFLADVTTPLGFWARRQAHETTVHMVDALAGTLGRLPTAEETAVPAELAVDGIDELLRGFFSRGRSKLYDGTEHAFAVAPTDADRRWCVHVAERLVVSDDGEASTTLSGTAAQLYLGLWNRGHEITVKGDAHLLDRWRKAMRIRWS